jgi:hypothetical protein
MLTLGYNDWANLGDYLGVVPVYFALYELLKEPFEILLPLDLKKYRGIEDLFKIQKFCSYCDFIDCGKRYLKFTTLHVDDYDYNCSIPKRTLAFKLGLEQSLGIKLNLTSKKPLLNIPFKEINSNVSFVGDRTLEAYKRDPRRKYNMLKDSGLFNTSDFIFLNYNNSVLSICMDILSSNKPFISTFTGVSVLAHFIGKDIDLYYDKDIEFWENYNIQQTFSHHYYNDGSARLININ